MGCRMTSRVDRYRQRQKEMGRKQALFYVTEEEHAQLKSELERLRSGVTSNDAAALTPNGRKQPVRHARSRGVGAQIANFAIAELKRIPKDDGLRQDAFDTVVGWIETNR